MTPGPGSVGENKNQTFGSDFHMPNEPFTNKIYKSFAESTLVDLINRMQILVFPEVRNVRVKSFKYSMSKEIRKLFEGTH